MNVFVVTLISIYSKLLLLYPRSFRKEFGEEMQVVFGDSVNEAGKDGILFPGDRGYERNSKPARECFAGVLA
jgi:hypothetical protein